MDAARSASPAPQKSNDHRSSENLSLGERRRNAGDSRGGTSRSRHKKTAAPRVLRLENGNLRDQLVVR